MSRFQGGRAVEINQLESGVFWTKKCSALKPWNNLSGSSHGGYRVGLEAQD